MFRFLAVVSLLVYSCFGATIHMQRRPRLDGRIVGGQPADITSYPYQVSFEFFGGHHCGAAIINEYWVVTAGHCVDSIPTYSITFRAGSNLIEEGGYVHEATEVISHSNYDFHNLDNDIAVVKVTEAFIYNSAVQPISLVATEPPAGAVSVVTGWGATSSGSSLSELLLEVSVPIVNRDQCNASYSQHGGITESMICAGAEEGGKDSCQGDSGGPLAIDGKLAGIVSWGLGCGVRGYPGIYSNVAVLRDFVLKYTNVSGNKDY